LCPHRLAAQEYIQSTVNHVEEFVRGQVHTQGIDNLWSLLKRSLAGTYVAVAPFQIDRYVTKQVFRYNDCATKDDRLANAGRVALLMSQIAGRRLTYAGVAGKLGTMPFESLAFRPRSRSSLASRPVLLACICASTSAFTFTGSAFRIMAIASSNW
jgi:hypothetical protein